MEPRYLVVVTTADGLIVRNTPRSQAAGGVRLRAEPVGAQLYGNLKINTGGAEYVSLLPRNPNQPEWVRVSESSGAIRYADVYDLQQSNVNSIAEALNRLANACDRIAISLGALVSHQ